MANHNANTKSSSEATTHVEVSKLPLPIFAPFDWVPQAKRLGPYDTLSDTRDIADGVSLIMQMVEKSALLDESGAAPLIEAADSLRLTRMSIAAMHFVVGSIDRHFDGLNERATIAAGAK